MIIAAKIDGKFGLVDEEMENMAVFECPCSYFQSTTEFGERCHVAQDGAGNLLVPNWVPFIYELECVPIAVE